MLDAMLSDRRVLVVEDEYLLASDIAKELADAGATVLGPVGTLEDAVAAIEAHDHIDGVVLDVNLRGELAFPAADLLLTRGVPFVFNTGYDRAALPTRFAHVVRCEKPINRGWVTQAIGRVIHQ